MDLNSADLSFYILTLTFLFSVRSPMVERIFGSLQLAFRIHIFFALTALGLMGLHFAQESLELISGISDLMVFLEEGGLLAGLLSLLLFGFVSTFAWKKSWPHKIWLKVHHFSILAWLLALFHIYLFVEDLWLRPDLVFCAGVSFFAILRTQLFHRWSKWGAIYVVHSQRQIHDKYFELNLRPLGQKELRPTRSGAYYYLRFGDLNFSRDWHPFTSLSEVGASELKFVVKSRGSDTNKMAQLSVGSLVNIEGPYGQFKEQGSIENVWIVGGVGVNAVLPKLRSGNPRVLHVVDSPEDIFYSLIDYQKKESTENKTFNIWFSQEKGYVTLEAINDLLKGLKNPQIFLAGPYPFTQHIQKLLRELSIKERNIHMEEKIF